MKILALTGGIASGKSTVAEMFSDCGAICVHADKVAHLAYRPKTAAYQSIIDRYGSSILEVNSKQIDRKKLADILFKDSKEKQWLESIIHPATRELIGKKIQATIQKKPPLILVEAALHVETGFYKAFDGLIVVDVAPPVQRERLKLRDGLTESQINQRLKNQWSLKKKRDLADWVIDNSSTIENTKKQVIKLYQQLIK